MPTTGPADRDGHALEPVAATREAGPATPAADMLMDRQSNEGLIAQFLLGYRDRTRAAYQADLRDFSAWCARAGIGLLDVHALTSRPTCTSWSKFAEVAPLWPGGWRL
jgi:hypothetical protein